MHSFSKTLTKLHGLTSMLYLLYLIFLRHLKDETIYLLYFVILIKKTCFLCFFFFELKQYFISNKIGRYIGNIYFKKYSFIIRLLCITDLDSKLTLFLISKRQLTSTGQRILTCTLASERLILRATSSLKKTSG